MIASIIVEVGAKAVDKVFDYKIPNELIDRIKIGSKVVVPFATRTLEGFVLGIKDTSDYDDVKSIISVSDDILLDDEMIYIGKEIAKKTLCSLVSAYQVMLPKALRASYGTDIRVKYQNYLVLNDNYDDDNIRGSKQKEILDILREKKEIKIDKMTSSIKLLVDKGICFIDKREVYRYNINTNKVKKEIVLTDEQRDVVKKVNNYLGEEHVFLLYGVTGSGKTEVYMEIIDRVLLRGETAIMLVPEISLTPQIVERFYLKFGDNVAILHSALSDSEKYDEYRKILRGEVKIVIGARSAIFAPLKDIGIIIIDEEHSSTYKQDNNPRYNARDVAILRGEYHKCPVLLGSATPSLESMARACNHVYDLLMLTKRAGSSRLPNVVLVDMKNEIKIGNKIISSVLDDKIRDTLSKNEQVILLLNHRGYSSIISCGSCGEVYKCPNCDISLTYHKTSNMLRCHYCNYSVKKYDKCPKCGGTDVKDYGLGTQKLEEEIGLRYNARVVRMDIDTTSRKGSHEKIINDFGEHKYDILVGTQMIAKGLDFPLVTLVGVINADASLNIPDFRASERTFQLLSQVSGRAGRGSSSGSVVIQTYNKDHYSIEYAKRHDYLSFYKEEMLIRKKLNYTPYYFITVVRIITNDYDLSFSESKKVFSYLKENLDKSTMVIGPAMASVFRVNNLYYQQCIIKYKKDDKLVDTLYSLDNIYKTNSKVSIEIDVEPNRL